MIFVRSAICFRVIIEMVEQWYNSIPRSGCGTKMPKDISPLDPHKASPPQILHPILFCDTSTPGTVSVRICQCGSRVSSSSIALNLILVEYNFLFLPFTNCSTNHSPRGFSWVERGEKRSPRFQYETAVLHTI